MHKTWVSSSQINLSMDEGGRHEVAEELLALDSCSKQELQFTSKVECLVSGPYSRTGLIPQSIWETQIKLVMGEGGMVKEGDREDEEAEEGKGEGDDSVGKGLRGIWEEIGESH